jgi:hypothetical protein
VVNVAGENDDGGRGIAVRAFARCHGPQQPGEVVEGVAEGGPVLEVHELANRLAEPRRRRAPGSSADGLACGLEVVEAG